MHIVDDNGALIGTHNVYVKSLENPRNSTGRARMWLDSDIQYAVSQAIKYIDSWHTDQPLQMPEIAW